MSEPLKKVDSAVQGLSSSPPKEKGHRKTGSFSNPDVRNIADLGTFEYASLLQAPSVGFPLANCLNRGRGHRAPYSKGDSKNGMVCFAAFPHSEFSVADQPRKINTSPQSIDDKDILKKLLTTPPVRKIDLHFPLGLEVTARNMKGVTVKDALDAIHKQFKKRVCLVGFDGSSQHS